MQIPIQRMIKQSYTDLDDDMLRHMLDLNDTSSYQDEQIFTNTFFGILQLLGADGLNTIFGETIFKQNEPFDKTPKIAFDEYLDEKRPDAVLETDQTVMMVEVKTGADYQPDQLSDQLRELRNEYNSKNKQKLVNITGHLTPPAEATKVSGENEFEWISWYNIDTILLKKLKSSKDIDSTKRVFSLLHQLLSMHGYTGFARMDYDALEAVSDTTSKRKKIVREFETLTRSIVSKIGNETEGDIVGPKFWGMQKLKSSPSEGIGMHFAAFNPNIVYNRTNPKPGRPFGYIQLTETTQSISGGLSLRVNQKNDNEKEYYSGKSIENNREELFSLVQELNGNIVLSPSYDTKNFTDMAETEYDGVIINLSTGEQESLSQIHRSNWEEMTHNVKRITISCRHNINKTNNEKINRILAEEILQICNWARNAH